MAATGEIKNLNMNAIRNRFNQNKTMSKNELSCETGLSFSTVSRLVDSLVQSGELSARGAGYSTGGRCAQRYSINPLFQVTLSMRIEAGSLKWYLFDLSGNCLESGHDQCSPGMLQAIDLLILRIKSHYPQLSAVAVGLSGNIYRGIVAEMSGSDELQGVNLPEHFKDRHQLPAVAAGDMSILSMGYYSRCITPPKAVVCIRMGNNALGGGAVLNGSVWRGASEFAGELCYLPVDKNTAYTKSYFQHTDIPAYYGTVIRSYAALLNPDLIILYQNDYINGKIDSIKQYCADFLPSQAIPRIELSEDLDRDYECGLMRIAYDLLRRP